MSSSSAYAAGPVQWQMSMQQAVTDVAEQIHRIHTATLIISCCIVLFVLALLSYAVIRFRASRNPVPSKTTHNVFLEVLWTLVPVLIIMAIAIPSLKVLYSGVHVPPSTDLLVKVVGKQWFWEYQYPDVLDEDGEEVSYESHLLCRVKADCPDGALRLLSTTTSLVVPVNKSVKLHVTSADVIHSFTVPAFGIKIDAIPGRLNQGWFRAEKVGTFYGQCSELCGLDHAFMPIQVKVVTEERFAEWLKIVKVDAEEADKLLLPPSTD